MFFEMNMKAHNNSTPVILSKEGATITPNRGSVSPTTIPWNEPVVKDIGSIWDKSKFLEPRKPICLGMLSAQELETFTKCGVPSVLDMPIKFPGSDFRIPAELAQFVGVIQKIINHEAIVNGRRYDEYFAYLTIDQCTVTPGKLQRETPCHVDGHQGARWKDKLPINHTYTVGSALPTRFYVQPFDIMPLDEAKHHTYKEFDRQVALTGDRNVWQPKPGELTMMDTYCVHRGAVATESTPRTWLRLSFDVRQFDRLGNTHNPMFNYNWKMVPRDVEPLGLVAYQPPAQQVDNVIGNDFALAEFSLPRRVESGVLSASC